MSLIHWWPLNGNITDNGADNFTLSATPSFSAAGKIGKCATNTNINAGLTYLSNQTLPLAKDSPISIFTWVYMNDYSTTGANLNGLVSNYNHGHNSDKGSGFGLNLRNNGNSFQVSISTSSTGGRTYSTYCGNTTFSAGEWHHVGFTYNGSRINFYLDGNYDGGLNFTSSYSSNNPIGIFCWSTGYSGYSSSCQLNDVRIYNHALSAKEVKEISKGLVLHYNFEDEYIEPTTNLIEDGNTFSSWSSYGFGSHGSKTILSGSTPNGMNKFCRVTDNYTNTYNTAIDSHYDSLVLTYNNQIVNRGSEILIDHDAVMYGSVYPKSYTVSFVSEMGVTPESQTVIYKHLVEEPDPQVIEGYILDRWAINEETWDFDTSEVYENTVLTAKWIEYSEPTIFTVSISEPNTTVTLNLSQSKENGVKVIWNLLNGEQLEETNNAAGQVSFTHTYAEPGPYTIQILRQNGTYLLGKNNDESAVMPAAVLTDIQFAFDITTTNPGAFRGAVNLTNANLTRFMTSIASSMFDGCSSLATLSNYTLELPDAITSIGSAAFRGCTSLSRVTLPAKLHTLGENAFRNCSNITAVVFEQNCPLTVIQDYAFSACEHLEQITLPKNLTTIESNAFSSCTTIEEIQLPATVVNIGDSVFSYCKNLSHIVIPATNMMSFGTCNFEGCPQLQTAGPIKQSGGNYAIEFGWNSNIPARAFSASAYDAPIALESIALPDNIKEIGDNAFFNCNKLLSINLSPTLESPSEPTLEIIGDNCFTYCWQL